MSIVNNLGNVVGLIKSPVEPIKTYILWAKQIDPLNNPDEVVLHTFKNGIWEPLSSLLKHKVIENTIDAFFITSDVTTNLDYGYGLFYTPKYESFQVFVSGVYNLGDKFIWGGKVWVKSSTIDSNDYAINAFILNNNWTIESNLQYYNAYLDEIVYSITEDIIIERKSQEIHAKFSVESYKEIAANNTYKPLSVIQWGNPYRSIKEGNTGIHIEDSYCEFINIIGSIKQLKCLSFSNFSIQGFNGEILFLKNITIENNGNIGIEQLSSANSVSFENIEVKNESFLYLKLNITGDLKYKNISIDEQSQFMAIEPIGIEITNMTVKGQNIIVNSADGFGGFNYAGFYIDENSLRFKTPITYYDGTPLDPNNSSMFWKSPFAIPKGYALINYYFANNGSSGSFAFELTNYTYSINTTIVTEPILVNKEIFYVPNLAESNGMVDEDEAALLLHAAGGDILINLFVEYKKIVL